MLERELFVLRLLSVPHEASGLPVRFGNEVGVWVVRYLRSKDIHAFFHVDVPLPGAEDVWEYARWRGVAVEAEEALQRAKDAIIFAVRDRMPWAKFCPIRIAPDNVSIRPGRTVLIYRRTNPPSVRITKSKTRLSVLTFSSRPGSEPEPEIAVPPIPQPVLVESRRREGEGEVLLVSEELFDFLVRHHAKAKEAEAEALKAYARLSDQMHGLEMTIRAIQQWANEAAFTAETEEGAVEEGKAVSWREILAKKLNTSPDRLVVSGPAVLFPNLGRWALISVFQIEGGVARVGEREFWSFRFPK